MAFGAWKILNEEEVVKRQQSPPPSGDPHSAFFDLSAA
jgi:hypothetical protein